MAELIPRTHLMTESEWRNLGVQQSPGWIHYMIHEPGKNKLKTFNKQTSFTVKVGQNLSHDKILVYLSPIGKTGYKL